MSEQTTTVPHVPVDWDAAGAIAARLVRPGPTASRAELSDLVADLRLAAGRAADHVARLTGLEPADGLGISAAQPLARVLVVDRSAWARANTQVLAGLVPGAPAEATGTVTSYAGAAQVAGMIAALSSRVLGQFDPYSTSGTRGRLLLVAPNVLSVERELSVAPADFRLWVALHEQTHALQFAAAPWLADHLRERAARFLQLAKPPKTDDDDGRRASAADSEPTGDGVVAAPTTLSDLVERVARVASEAVRGGESGLGGGPLLAGLLGTEQAQIVKEISAVMALLEGHADVTMDAVGPKVVPSVVPIRASFDARRARAGSPVQRVLRRLLGLDAKLAQYREGAAFVRAVEAEVGREGLAAAFSGPAQLPSMGEIEDPASWVARVHG